MAKCDYCGEEAGFLRKVHKECQTKHDTGLANIAILAADAALSPEQAASVEAKMAEIASESHITLEEKRECIIRGWQQAVNLALDDDLLTSEEEDALQSFAEAFSLTQKDLDSQGAYSRLVKAAVIRDILEGHLPQRMQIRGQMPINFQKSETLIWVFPDVEYLEQRSRIRYEGGYQGMSVRVAKGLYYRVGGFRGNPVSTLQVVHIDTGIMAITDKHIYFSGPNKAFRLKYEKVISFTPYSDGIGIQRDAATAKPQIFITGDGWFTYNLIWNLAKGFDALTSN